MQNAEWASENAELAEINGTRLNFDREPLTS